MSDRYVPPSQRLLAWVSGQSGGERLVRIQRLTGGASAHVDRIVTTNRAVVLRRWPGQWGPGLVARESAALSTLDGAALPVAVPQLLGADPTGSATGESCLLMSAVQGHTDLRPGDIADYVGQLAVTLARIHNLPARLEFTDPYGVECDAGRDWIGDPTIARVANEAAVAAVGTPVEFVHADYQPMNVLWDRQSMISLVDWAFAGRGIRELDVGQCRLALATLFSVDAAEQFLRRYEREAGARLDKRADIRALLAYGPGWRDFLPRVVAGRIRLDMRGMNDRVATLLRQAIARLD